MFEFKFADKLQIEQLLPDLFRILHSNMSIIAPNENPFSQEDGFLFVLFTIHFSSFIIHYQGTDFRMNNEKRSRLR